MKRTSILGAFFLFCSYALAQQSTQMPAPRLPASVIGPQLVVWSELQKPQPTPQPLPPPERADQPPAAQPQQTQPPAESQQPAIQGFTGTIMKDGGKYVLKVSENVSYQIDDQDKAKNFEGKQVKVSGTLDPKTNVLHIANIELLS